MDIYLHNTLTGRKERFEPLDPARVTLYVCGPTVYNFAHIGNARPAVVFDVLARLLRRQYTLVYARNITDLDDKINAAAREAGVSAAAVAEKYAAIYRDDMSALGVLPPDIEPRATAHIPEMIAMIETLIAGGFAYAADGHVLFHVPAFDAYGRLSKRDRNDMLAGARVEVAPYKRDPSDFVLWKPSPADIPGWDSPWGRGRPGWHLECTAMIERHLGETIDIHGGGNDLIFPHHENEIAQGTCAHGGRLYCRYWLHNGFVNIDSEKMSKSVGNVLLVHELLKSTPGEAIRFALLRAHYRQPLDWTAESLAQSRKTLDRLYGVLRDTAEIDAGAVSPADADPAVLAALSDDLNTPDALAELHHLAHRVRGANDDARPGLKRALLASGAALGLLQQDPVAWFRSGGADTAIDPAEIDALIDARREARKRKDFKEADRIRDDLASRGIALEDGPDGTVWRVGA